MKTFFKKITVSYDCNIVSISQLFDSGASVLPVVIIAYWKLVVRDHEEFVNLVSNFFSI